MCDDGDIVVCNRLGRPVDGLIVRGLLSVGFMSCGRRTMMATTSARRGRRCRLD
jgi:hypothetical protein